MQDFDLIRIFSTCCVFSGCEVERVFDLMAITSTKNVLYIRGEDVLLSWVRG